MIHIHIQSVGPCRVQSLCVLRKLKTLLFGHSRTLRFWPFISDGSHFVVVFECETDFSMALRIAPTSPPYHLLISWTHRDIHEYPPFTNVCVRVCVRRRTAHKKYTQKTDCWVPLHLFLYPVCGRITPKHRESSSLHLPPSIHSRIIQPSSSPPSLHSRTMEPSPSPPGVHPASVVNHSSSIQTHLISSHPVWCGFIEWKHSGPIWIHPVSAWVHPMNTL